MATIRQDAWSQDDDLILAEVTMRNIRDGGTQLEAFDEVAARIGRTSAACGFRWNSFVRKQYEAAIQIAKAQRQHRPLRKREEESTSFTQDGFSESSSIQSMDRVGSIEDTIKLLRAWKQEQAELTRQVKLQERELRDKEIRIQTLERENELLRRNVNHVETDYQTINEDYKALIQIMDRARKMAFLHETDTEDRPRFKMDANGNLERVD
jgi:prespore-specific regulator